MKTLGSKSLTYEFSTLDKVATEEEHVKSTLGTLKLRNINRLIFCQIDTNSRNEKYNL